MHPNSSDRNCVSSTPHFALVCFAFCLMSAYAFGGRLLFYAANGVTSVTRRALHLTSLFESVDLSYSCLSRVTVAPTRFDSSRQRAMARALASSQSSAYDAWARYVMTTVQLPGGLVPDVHVRPVRQRYSSGTIWQRLSPLPHDTHLALTAFPLLHLRS